MPKHLLFIFCFLFYSCIVLAKREEKHPRAVKKGNVILTAGYGAPSIIRAYLKYKTTRDQIKVYGSGPYILKTEYMLNDRLGICLNGAYNQSKITWEDIGYDTVQKIYRKFEFGIKAYEVSGTLRLNYHFWHREKIDSYGGLAVGYGLIHMASYTKAHTTRFSIMYDFPIPLILECTWGLRYFPTKRIGVYTELGIGKSWVLFNKYFLAEALGQVGVVVKL